MKPNKPPSVSDFNSFENKGVPEPKLLLFNMIKALCQFPQDVFIKESFVKADPVKHQRSKIVYRIMCDYRDAGWIVGDSGIDPNDRPGAVLRGIRNYFRNIAIYVPDPENEESGVIFDIDLDDSVKQHRFTRTRKCPSSTPKNV